MRRIVVGWGSLAAVLVLLLTVLAVGPPAEAQGDEGDGSVELPADWPPDVVTAVEAFDHPATEFWIGQATAHEEQPRTEGWLRFETYALQQGRDVLALPTFEQMAAANRVASELVVRLTTGTDPGSLAPLGLTDPEELGGLVEGLHRFEIDPAVDFVALLEEVNADPGVRYAEPGYIAEPAAVPNDPASGSGLADAWWLLQIDAFDAWDLATDATPIGPVMVFDQGILTTHEDLVDNLWVNPDDGSNGLRITPNLGSHGTPVAGSICGQGNNGIGYAGTAWDCELMEVRAELLFSNVAADFATAIAYAVDNGSRLSNHSWRVFTFSQSIADTVDAAEAAGHLVIAAAGNEANDIDADGTNYPARLPNPNVLSIAASTTDESRISYSSYGPVSVDLAAPTEYVVPNYLGGYQGFSGTSQATPTVAGAVALAWSQNPALSATEIKQLVVDTARPVASWNGLTVTGGILDMEALVQAAQPGGPATIGGTVSDGNGEPVASMAIDLFTANADGSRGQWLSDTRTGDDGRYSFTAEAGCYVVTFIAPDGETFVGGDSWLNRSICVQAGETVEDLDAQLVDRAQLGSLGGLVSASDDGPVADLAVDLFTANGDGSRGTWLSDARTGADGRFSFTVEAGCYVLTYIAPDGESFVGGSGFLNRSVCVAAGETISDLDAKLAAAASAALGGTIGDADGGFAVGVTADLFTANGDGSRGLWLSDTTTDGDGTYRFDVAPGCYVVTLIAPAGRSFVGGAQYLNLGRCVADGESMLDLDAQLAPSP